MPLREHLVFSKQEVTDLFAIIITLSFLFSLTFMRFSNSEMPFPLVFILFIFFFIFMLFGKILIMKIDAYRHGFEIHLRQTYFDRYGLRVYDTISSKMPRPETFKGIPMIFISFFIYIFSFGFIVFPCLWNYTVKKIPYKHIGTYERFEHSSASHFKEITYFRYSKVIFLGFIYYLFYAFILKLFLSNTELYYWFMAIIFWIAFITIMPIPGSEGYELYGKNLFAWFSVVPILILGMLALLVFQNIFLTMLAIVLLVFLVFAVVFYKYVMG